MTSLIAYYKPVPNPKMRLFCFHHAGGGASSFREWQPYLEPLEIEVVPIQLPGREYRIAEPCITSVPELVELMTRELAPYVDRPFALWGHSMGALLAYEFGVQIQSTKPQGPACLIASAKDAPHVPMDLEPTVGLSDAAFIEVVHRYGGLPSEVLADGEMLGLVLPALRADFQLCEAYQRQDMTKLDCPIFGYGGIRDGAVQHQGLMGWEALTSDTFTLRRFPGGHFYTQSHFALLMKALGQDLTSVLAQSTSQAFSAIA